MLDYEDDYLFEEDKLYVFLLNILFSLGDL